MTTTDLGESGLEVTAATAAGTEVGGETEVGLAMGGVTTAGTGGDFDLESEKSSHAQNPGLLLRPCVRDIGHTRL